jgi:hypothetical protein
MLARWTGLQTDLAEARADLAALRADADALREDAAELRSDAGCLRADLADARVDARWLRTSLEAAEAARDQAEEEASALTTLLVAVTADRDGLRGLLRETEEMLETEADARVDAEEALAWERHERGTERKAETERHEVEVEAAAEQALRQVIHLLAEAFARPFNPLPADHELAAAQRCGALIDALTLAKHHAASPEERAAYAELRDQLNARVRDALAASMYDVGAVGRRMAAALALAPADDQLIPNPSEVETVDDLAAGVGA